jgi:hypothetical protein
MALRRCYSKAIKRGSFYDERKGVLMSSHIIRFGCFSKKRGGCNIIKDRRDYGRLDKCFYESVWKDFKFMMPINDKEKFMTLITGYTERIKRVLSIPKDQPTEK